MFTTLASFSSLFLSTFVMLVGVGLFNVFMGLKLSEDGVSAIWIGALMSAYYLGLVIGSRVGHRMIVRVGHVRAFAAAAATCSVMVLIQTLVSEKEIWVLFRVIAGAGMAVQFMVLESWLNEQIENERRGQIFSVYLVMSGLGTAIGQMAITLYPSLDLRPLILVAICHVVGLIPIVWTVRLHPAPQLPAPLDFGYFLRVAPAALVTMFVAGNISSAFYALAPVYVIEKNFSTPEVAAFMSVAVFAGLMAQWPMGWMSDRIPRQRLILFNGAVLTFVTLLLWGWLPIPFWLLMMISAVSGVMQFTLYALAGSFANDLVTADRRVSLSAVLLMSFGIGACLGPLLAGGLMRLAGVNMLYVFFSACAVILILTSITRRKPYVRQSDSP
ncbi:MFS transporter [Orrella daihaiensis]|uniref:MFS transporter n=1 Tax=Orrella daihaiensis TaxID=2782176 RepID=A0ABY4ALC1_9BURK|nr:MFS transporter [Orrella daihaiensis]UOD51096.1 MFS transporter [Orrella daihaiensis]